MSVADASNSGFRANLTIVASYPYRSSNGQLIHEGVRCTNGDGQKHFYQRRPHPFQAGGFINDIDGLVLLPYRLPELVHLPDHSVVLVAEGEKDADGLNRAFREARKPRYCATTAPGGAGKWPDSLTP